MILFVGLGVLFVLWLVAVIVYAVIAGGTRLPDPPPGGQFMVATADADDAMPVRLLAWDDLSGAVDVAADSARAMYGAGITSPRRPR